MTGAVFAYSRQGCRTAKRIVECLGGVDWQCYTVPRLCGNGFAPLGSPAGAFYGGLFQERDVLVFVSACGIAVREIAPHVRDKRTDPAVLCVDETGRFVIPLLSGHIGGANALARRLAGALGAEAVITTATDRNDRFSVDTWASEQGLIIDDMAAAKAVSAAILEGDVAFCADFPVVTDYPPGLVPAERGEIGVCVSCRRAAAFENTLYLIPQVVHLGIGCRRGTAAETIAHAVDAVLEAAAIDHRAVKQVASIDLKADEAGLLTFCRERGWRAVFYSPQELQTVEGAVSRSAFVKQVTGVDNVCERAALRGAEHLIVKKTAAGGVTVAAAVEKWEVRFG